MSEKKIIRPTPRWKLLLGVPAALALLYAASLLFARLVTPDTTPHPLPWSEAEIAAARASRATPDQIDRSLRIARPVAEETYRRVAAWRQQHPGASPETVEAAVAAGELPAWYPRHQSPLLDVLEKEGVLPPVAERVGPEPVVMRGVEGIGRYGGVWVQFVAGASSEISSIDGRMSYARLFRFGPFGYPLDPHIAKDLKVYDGGRTWVLTLRKIRWSDGTPFTADDLLYRWYDEEQSPAFGASPASQPKYYMVSGKPGKLEKIDDHTVRYTFPEPVGNLREVLAYYGVFSPSKFRRKYHPAHGDPIFIRQQMKKYNMANPRALYSLMTTSNPEAPTLGPWMYRKYTTGSPIIFVRNPYYFGVDEEGNQLPYIDRIQFELIDGLMLPLAVSSGRASMQFRYLRFENYTDYASRARENNYRLLGWLPGTRSDWLIYPNLNRGVDANDPTSEFKGKLLFEADFRKALSLAIDRAAVIRSLYSGAAKPEQVDPGPYSDYPSPRLRNAYTRLDPDRANAMLDALWTRMGLDPTVRKDGFRCDREGRMLTFYLYFTEFTGMGPAQFVVDDWAKIGIRCIYQQCSRPLLEVRKSSRNFDFYIWSSESEMVPLMSPRCFVPVGVESAFALGWGNWFYRNGLYDHPSSRNPGCVPVPRNHPMYEAMLCYEAALHTTDETVKQQKMRRITDIAADNLWTINVASAPPKLLVVSNDLHNVPEKALEGYFVFTPGHAGVETYYFGHPNRAADADTIAQIREATPIPPAAGTPDTGGEKLFKLLAWGIALALLALLILRHPFVLRRLVIMVPTLLVISICVFTIVQLPPGNYLSNRIMQLQESGASEQQIQQQVDDLQAMFRFDDPAWKRYCRWMGFTYLVTFDKSDRGLLQGDMGYSMETNKSVNSMVGDRILLTVLISLGTVLLTWSLALPIGIYSACRQYSIGDYIFSVIGFLGMCIPSFLLALILMALTGISGLFSPEFAIQPEWTAAKVADMLRHIWVPVLVVGVAGTAGMIRVMRANLLDELRKPYVTTARAKGVRPLKLLFKYPVRIALNPFISGIGTLFPALVSGSSIVAIVMSLPTVGPLMLSALFSQDMNMAGSMLMVLSMLGVFGTLVSDLLLMAVDPRIRIGGGSTR